MENLNKRKLIPSLAAIAFCFGVSTTANASIALEEYAINIDGTITGAAPGLGDPIPLGLDAQGLGTLTFNITGTGSHSFDAFFDYEITETGNTFFNETGSSNGIPATDPGGNQSWEIDEPGFVDGDIFENFQAGTLDNEIGTSIYGNTTFPDDVSMALGWDFNLLDGDTATIMLMLSTTQPTSGFYLAHSDPGILPGTGINASDPTTIYFSSTLGISPIPVPAAIWLFGSGLVGLIGFSRRKATA